MVARRNRSCASRYSQPEQDLGRSLYGVLGEVRAELLDVWRMAVKLTGATVTSPDSVDTLAHALARVM